MYHFYKRIFDVIFSSIAILLLAPIIILLTLLLFINNKGKPYFYQKRPGQYARVIKIIKFKTMNDRKDTLGNLLPDADRLTLFGSFLRKTSLDELPSLFNVLKGEMSLVGPRPLLMQYLPLYNETQKRRHEVKPGITGLAQVNGRNAISWEMKFELDVWYVDNQSFFLDLKILFLTVFKVLKREGISADGEATMQPFLGNKN